MKGDKKRLVCQHPSDLLCSLTCEQDWRRTVRRCLDNTSSIAILFNRTFPVLRMRHMMRMHIPSKMIMNDNYPQHQDFLFWLWWPLLFFWWHFWAFKYMCKACMYMYSEVEAYRNLLFFCLVNFCRKNIRVKKFSDRPNWTKIFYKSRVVGINWGDHTACRKDGLWKGDSLLC